MEKTHEHVTKGRKDLSPAGLKGKDFGECQICFAVTLSVACRKNGKWGTALLKDLSVFYHLS